MNWSSVLFLFVAGLVICTGRSIDSDYLSDNHMEDPDLFEGDIMGIDPKADRNAVVKDTRLWPKGRVPYVIDNELKDQKQAIKKAMDQYKEKTCIRFVPRTNEEYYIKIFRGKGCSSFVGKVKINQTLSLGDGCYKIGTIVHELGHAIGFYHEHSRSDRDNYLNIHYENIKPGLENQFDKRKPMQNRLLTSFDYNSIMLYGETTFSKDRKKGLKTMTAKDGRKLLENYQKPGLSKEDIRRISKLYKC